MVTIKEIEADSLTALNELYRELIGAPAEPGKFGDTFAAIKADSRYVLLGAYVDGELMGSLMGITCLDLVGDCRPFMVIENVVVSARARRQGLGKQLMDAIEKSLMNAIASTSFSSPGRNARKPMSSMSGWATGRRRWRGTESI